jgi:hypothetical protein
MTDVAFHASIRRQNDPAASLLSIGLELAEMPCVAANLIPDDATLIAFGEKEPPPPPRPKPPSVAKPELPKELKKQLLKLAALAHQRELREALMQLDSKFAQWKAEQLSVGQLLDEIHRFHNGTARDLYSRYRMGPPALAVALALRKQVVTESEAGAAVMAHFR